jgi:hypothetical protein
MIYGSDATTAAALRTMQGGKLKLDANGMLPLNNATNFPNGTVSLVNDAHRVPDDELFAAGDVRANENIELTGLHTLFAREHNRQASRLASMNPSLSDQELYTRARAIVVGELQSITYNEWLPAVLGNSGLPIYQGYNPRVNPQLSNEFSTAAFRFGHSLLGDDIEFLDNNGIPIANQIPLSEAFFNPKALDGVTIESMFKYLASDPASEFDLKVVGSVRNLLFGAPGQGGFDLASLNIQRGRDHGLADYNDTRAAIDLPRARSFADITRNRDVQAKLQQVYGSVDKIDLWVGVLAEDHVPGASVGPTAGRINSEQFRRMRDGDRFWYQNTFTGSLLRWQMHRLQWEHVETELLACARILEGSLRGFSKALIESLSQDLGFPPGPLKPPPRPADGKRRPPPRPPMDQTPKLHVPPDSSQSRKLNETSIDWQNIQEPDLDAQTEEKWESSLRLPKSFPTPGGRTEEAAYFVIWREDTTILSESSNAPQVKPNRLEVNDIRFLRERYVIQQRNQYREVFVRGPRDTMICVGRDANGNRACPVSRTITGRVSRKFGSMPTFCHPYASTC